MQTTFPASSSDVTLSKWTPCSFHNMIEIEVFYKDVITLIPSYALLQLQRLEKIDLRVYGLKEVFEVVSLEESGFNESQTTVVKIPNLKQVTLNNAYDLKYVGSRKERSSKKEDRHIAGRKKAPVIARPFPGKKNRSRNDRTA
ncbi:hypothetical protein E3N88_02067 [Mikania micrantha]|uniref:Uncharacterized protein n=1 Tax=Mikania micrantha TaxID=192012 RepID=A0A5N6Q4R4_9ASTR|nr:hypothetical protein E3N88_02067 [Mikania micrantha]